MIKNLNKKKSIIFTLVIVIFYLIIFFKFCNRSFPKEIYDDFKSKPIGLNENERNIKQVIMSRECKYVDLVYTWVNGSDPIHEESKIQRIGNFSYSPPTTNFRDIGTLKYSLRSVRQYAPWIKNIFIITANQIPTWFNIENPENVRFISHDDYFHKKSDLPSFNSNSIESNFWNLPIEVSNCFLYLNDDIILSRPVEQSDYFDENFNQVVFFNKDVLGGKSGNSKSFDEYTMGVLLTNRALAIIWGDGQEYKRNFPAHGIQVFNRKIWYKMQEDFGTGLEITSSHFFRNKTDFQMAHLYNQFAIKFSKCTIKTTSDVLYLQLNNDNFQQIFQKVDQLRLTINSICLNDGIELMTDEIQYLFDITFNEIFPIPSSFEK